ncbi:MAG: aldose 1-epimerase family protein, partial [Bacteroidales bacterium]|nr:aldose 1-epimerase family protein [Bacteroidales bacterium]
MIRSIENGRIRLTVSDSGAEIISALDKKTRRELVWCGDPAWWKRHTPVLFPIVGSIWENTMRVDGKEYHMSQHGFARDMDFTCIEETENSLAYELKSNEETLSKFPWKFTLRLIHSLDGSRVITRWEVTNDDSTDMYFQIGGHPAFNMPEGIKDTDKVAGFIRFGENDAESYKISSIGSKGCVKAEDSVLDCPGREIAITAGMFANDAIIFEENPPRVISIYDTDNKLVI